jgi:microcystin-dependent protein
MAGTLFGMGLQQQVDINGRPMSGCLLYLYDAGTSTPADSFQDFGLTVLNSWPLEADSSGRVPQFWLADGSYRARLTTSDGTEIFDFDGIQAIGASVASSGGGGGGGGSAVDANAILLTGDFLWRPTAGTRTGFVRANARTFGSASSGGVERANADTQPLFEFLWNNFSNALCPVGGGRGGTAAGDFTANKTIQSLDMRGYGIFGLDDMGNSAAGRLVTGTPTAAASSTGAEKTTLVLANLPAHDHGAGTYAVGAHTHGAGSFQVTAAVEGTNVAPTGGSGKQYATNNTIGVNGTSGSTAPTFSGTSGSTGSGTASTTISPGRLGTWFIKL